MRLLARFGQPARPTKYLLNGTFAPELARQQAHGTSTLPIAMLRFGIRQSR
jgi:hypothetical protein